MDPNQQHCANDDCPDIGRTDHGNIKVYSYKERRYYCTTCGQRFRASHDTVFYKLRTPRQDFIEAIGMLAERGSLRGIARVKEVKPDTVLHWLDLAGEQAATVSSQLLRNLRLTQVQIDELWTFVKKSRATSQRIKSWPGWVTIGFGRRSPCLLASASPAI
jgi:transposase-like protein